MKQINKNMFRIRRSYEKHHSQNHEEAVEQLSKNSPTNY